jgi:hypothetical protein
MAAGPSLGSKQHQIYTFAEQHIVTLVFAGCPGYQRKGGRLLIRCLRRVYDYPAFALVGAADLDDSLQVAVCVLDIALFHVFNWQRKET